MHELRGDTIIRQFRFVDVSVFEGECMVELMLLMVCIVVMWCGEWSDCEWCWVSTVLWWVNAWRWRSDYLRFGVSCVAHDGVLAQVLFMVACCVGGWLRTFRICWVVRMYVWLIPCRNYWSKLEFVVAFPDRMKIHTLEGRRAIVICCLWRIFVSYVMSPENVIMLEFL